MNVGRCIEFNELIFKQLTVYSWVGSQWAGVAHLGLAEKGFGDQEVDIKEIDLCKIPHTHEERRC